MDCSEDCRYFFIYTCINYHYILFKTNGIPTLFIGVYTCTNCEYYIHKANSIDFMFLFENLIKILPSILIYTYIYINIIRVHQIYIKYYF